jgi:hypothetical protein
MRGVAHTASRRRASRYPNRSRTASYSSQKCHCNFRSSFGLHIGMVCGALECCPMAYAARGVWADQEQRSVMIRPLGKPLGKSPGRSLDGKVGNRSAGRGAAIDAKGIFQRGHVRIARSPPSIGSITPVTQRASSLAR